MFGGSAWEWEPRRGQYYLHNFLKEQPDLNFHNPQVIEALLAQARFWLERGVDGFRRRRDRFRRPRPASCATTRRAACARVGGSAPGSPFAMQDQLWNKARPELIELFLKPLHALTERYDGKVLLGEISGDDALLRAAEYTNGGGLDIAYSFDLLSCPGTPKGIRGVVERLEKTIGDGWACWSFSNHDVRRAVTRWGGDDPPEGLRRLVPGAAGLACAARSASTRARSWGSRRRRSPSSSCKDPFGIAFWPAFAGRDGCRTPMPWEGTAPEAGFTAGEPWLPVPESHRRRAVDAAGRRRRARS